MALLNFAQGESQKLSVPFVKNGANVDLTQATQIIAVLTVGNKEVAKYALNAVVGYGTLQLAAGSTNIIEIYVERSQSKDFPTGALKACITAELPDVDTPSGSSATAINEAVATVMRGCGLNEPIIG